MMLLLRYLLGRGIPKYIKWKIIKATGKFDRINNFEFLDEMIDNKAMLFKSLSENKMNLISRFYDKYKNYNEDLLKINPRCNENKLINFEYGFMNACSAGNLEIVKLLMPKVNPHLRGLRNACKYGHAEIVKHILPFYKSYINDMLTISCENRHYDLTAWLINMGADKCDHCFNKEF